VVGDGEVDGAPALPAGPPLGGVEVVRRVRDAVGARVEADQQRREDGLAPGLGLARLAAAPARRPAELGALVDHGAERGVVRPRLLQAVHDHAGHGELAERRLAARLVVDRVGQALDLARVDRAAAVVLGERRDRDEDGLHPARSRARRAGAAAWAAGAGAAGSRTALRIIGFSP
jgi:hypothetical protein